MKRLPILLLLLSSFAVAQNSGQTTQIRNGATLPTTCDPNKGQVFFVTADGLYQCTATNTWTKPTTVQATNGVNSQTGTSYTVVVTDKSKLVTFNNSGSQAVTLPRATASFGAGWFANFENFGAGSVTITPVTSTIDGASSLVINQNQGFALFSDGTNWFTQRGVGGIGTFTVATLPGSAAEGTISNLTDGARGQYIYKNSTWRPGSPEINVQDFGARGDGGWYSGANCVSGSGSISNVGLSSGRLPKVGDTFQASTCGPAGGPLSCTITGGTATTGTLFGTVTCGGGVTASANVTGTPVYWGASSDDTASFQAAINYCGSTATGSGCVVKVPAGSFFLTNVTFPAAVGSKNGLILLKGMGRGTSNIVMTGAAQSCTLQAPASSVPVGVEGISFLGPRAVTATDPIAMCWYGGTNHFFRNNLMNSGYIMVSAANTWLNEITFNDCIAATRCLEYGGAAGTGPVNATHEYANHFTGFNDKAIYSHTNNSSFENHYGPDWIENDTTPYSTMVSIADNSSVWEEGYTEVIAPTGGYYVENHGNNNTLRWRAVGCMLNSQSARIESNGTNGSWPCAGHSYFIVQTGGSGASMFSGVGPADVDIVRAGDRFTGGRTASGGASDLLGNNNGTLGALMVYPGFQPGTQWDWPFGRVDIATIPYGFSDATTGNPSLPTSFGTSATIPLNARIANKFPSAGFPWGFAFHICTKNPGPCTANPITAADWSHFGNIETRVRTEGTSYAPNGFSWQAGDWFWNNTPNVNFIQGWMSVAGGSPGTGLRQPITQTATATGCATAAAAGATCTTTVTWPTAFPDTSYKAVCDGQLITSGIPLDGGQTAKAAGTVTFQTVAATAAAAQFTNVHCAAWHD